MLEADYHILRIHGEREGDPSGTPKGTSPCRTKQDILRQNQSILYPRSSQKQNQTEEATGTGPVQYIVTNNNKANPYNNKSCNNSKDTLNV